MTAVANPKPVRLGGPDLLHELIFSRKTPNSQAKIAIEALLETGEIEKINYHELDSLSTALGLYISTKIGFNPGQAVVIPILLPQSLELYITQLAILKAGAAFCPLNPDIPLDRLKFILNDVKATLLVTGSGEQTERKLLDIGIEVMPVDPNNVRNMLAGEQLKVMSSVTRADNLAYVMYTSGSTGLPKGVGVSHRAATQSLLAHDGFIPQFDRFLQFAAPTFDVSVFEIFFPLFRGSTVISVDRPAMLDDLPGVISRMNVDACELTPSVAGSLLGTRGNAPSLKLLMTIGEMLTERVIKEFGGSSDVPSILWAMYGPTEAAIHCTLAPALSATASPNMIGVPLDSVSCYIVSENDPFKVLDIGQTGELAIGGFQLADGYINRSEQTAAAFIDTPHGLLYRSGDRACMNKDGSLVCLGRISDGQVKLRGQRMELGEVEHAALRFSGCHGAVATVVEQVLVLFCAVQSEIQDVATLRNHIMAECKRWLPSFMIPGDIVLSSGFPRLASGKVDRKQLKESYAASIDRHSNSSEYASAEMCLLVEKVQSIVGANVTADMTLVSAGVDSLVSIKLATTLRDCGYEIRAFDIIGATRIKDLAHLLVPGQALQKIDNAHDAQLPGLTGLGKDQLPKIIPQQSVEDMLHCAPIQKAMLAETLKTPNAYCNRVNLQFGPDISPYQALETYCKLADLNPILRTGFCLVNDVFVQVVFKHVPIGVAEVVERADDGFQIHSENHLLRPWRLQVTSPGHNGPLEATLHIHHALYDGWSLEMLCLDWSMLLRGQTPSLRVPFSQVTSFHMAKTNDQMASRAFWAAQLRGCEWSQFPHLSQWVKEPNPTICQTPAKIQRIVQSISRNEVVEASRLIGCSPQTFFQVAVSYVLGQIMGTSRVVIGNVFSGRTQPMPGIETVIGPCITSLPLVIDFGSVLSSTDALRMVYSTEKAVLGHLDLPLKDVMEVAKVTPGTHLWTVLFAYQESFITEPGCVTHTCGQDHLESDILLEVIPQGLEFKLSIQTQTEVMSEQFSMAFLSHIDSVLRLLVHDHGVELSNMPTRVESACPSVFNAQYQTLERIPDVSVAFESAVTTNHDKPALVFMQERLQKHVPTNFQILSFGQLNEISNKIARLIQCVLPSTASPGIVAVIMEKSPLLYISILAILKSGHAYLPLLPSTPGARVETIMKHARVGLCLVDQTTYDLLSPHIHTQLLNLDISNASYFSRENLQHQPRGDRPAYIIYTSGTTGTSKAVVATHLNLLSNVDVLTKLYPFDSQSRLLQACSQAFDVSVFEIFWTWLNGLCLCSGTKDMIFDDLEFAIRELQVTHLSMTPTVASLIKRKNVPGVEFLVTAGEPMTEGVYNEWVSGVALFQGYGPSETTNICTVKNMRPGEHISHLGFAFSNTSAFVMPPSELTLVPIGTIGELVFGGDQVTAGYLNAPNLTAKKFVQHPDFGRLYRSGDLGRMLPDGSVMILGRIDDQVKVRGQRVDVGEINGIVTSSGLARTGVTILIKEGLLASFYVSLAGVGLSSEHIMLRQEVFDHFHSRLSSYMIPSFMIPVISIPLTSSGKMDRNSLLTVFKALDNDKRDDYAVPAVDCGTASSGPIIWSPHEHRIVMAVSEVLQIEPSVIKPWTSLVSIGLDSFVSIKVARTLSEQLKQKVSVASLLRSSTISHLAGEMAKSSSDLVISKRVLPQFSVEKRTRIVAEFDKRGLGVQSILPCTPLQTAMLASPDSHLYLCKMVFKLRQPLQTVRDAWGRLHASRAILRTAFISIDEAESPFCQVRLTTASSLLWSEENHGSINECLKHLAQIVGPAMDSYIPPLAFGSVETPESSLLCLVIHHALYDGIAMKLLLDEIVGLVEGHKLLPDGRYEDFLAVALDKPVEAPMFWRQHFQSFTPMKLPRCSKSPRDTPHQCHSVLLSTLFSDLEHRAKVDSTSILSIFQAAWSIVVSLSFGIDDVCFGNVVNGRHIDVSDAEQIAAPCFNTLPLRINLGMGNLSLSEIIAYFQRVNNEVRPFSFTALRSIQKELAPYAGSLFDTMLILQPPMSLDSHPLWEVLLDESSMDVPLVCEVLPSSSSDSCSVMLHFDITYIPVHCVDRLGAVLNSVIRLIAQSPKTSFGSILGLVDGVAEVCKISPKAYAITMGVHDDTVDDESYAWSPIAANVRKILSRLAKIELHKVKHNSTIYQLGLDSINAFQIATSLRSEGYSISGVDVLECRTCLNIAKHLGDSEVAHPGTASTTELILTPSSSSAMSSQSEDEIILDCTPIQDAMLTEFMNSDGAAYFNHFVLRMTELESIPQLQESMTALIRFHPMLRAGFLPADEDLPGRSTFQLSIYPSFETPVTICHSEFDLVHWKKGLITAALHDLSIPPWSACIFKRNSSLHIAFCLHHALYDAYSLDLMMKDLSLIIGGHHVPIYTVTDAAHKILSLASDAASSSKVYWENVGSSMVVNSFPVMTPLSQDHRLSQSCTFKLSLSSNRLRSFIRAYGISTQALVQAAWTRVLSVYLGEDSVTYGVVLSGRDDSGLEGSPFPCVTTLPMCASNQPSNMELLQDSMKAAMSLQRHQYSRPTDVQRWTGHANSRLFDTILVVQCNGHEESYPWTIVEDEGTVDYPVSIEIQTTKSSIILNLTYWTDVLPSGQAELLVKQLDHVINNLVEHPEGTMDILEKSNPELMSVIPAEMPIIPTSHTLLHEFVEKMAVRQPDALALEFVDSLKGSQIISRKWSYHELDTLGDVVTSLLQPHVSADDVVAIHFDKCPEAYPAILGILKSGCSFLALDPSAPADRKSFILQDSQAVIVLSGSGVPDLQTELEVLYLDMDNLQNLPITPKVASIARPETRSYCLYTSGTTGTPKGCELTHANAVQGMKAFQHLFSGTITPKSRCLQFAAFHFDVCVLEQYWSWSVGIPVVAAPRDLILADIEHTLAALEISHVDLTPSLAALVRPENVPSLWNGVFITGGEQLRREILEAWGPKQVIYNAYGPTEATIGVTMRRRVPRNGRPANIGHQFPNVGTFVLRRGTDIPVLRGGIGELCISGPLVGKGYLGRPDLTAEKFPILEAFGERVYRTGDLVRVLCDGSFDFLGRTDDQVKLRGQRLELGEINHAMSSGVPEIKHAVSLVAKHRVTGKDLLVSFISAYAMNASTATSPPEILCTTLAARAKVSCKERLPGYMIPTYCIELSYVPLSPNNKADVKQLRALCSGLSPAKLLQITKPAAVMPSLNPLSVGPLDNTLEALIIEALKAFSGVSEIDSDSNIFDCGVDSISVARFVRALRKRGISVANVPLVLQYPTPRELAHFLHGIDREATPSHVQDSEAFISAFEHASRADVCRQLADPAHEVGYIVPCTPLQEGMLARASVSEDGVYFNHFLLRLKVTSTERFQAAWAQLVFENAILRTIFVSTPNGFAQVAIRNKTLEWEEIDVDIESLDTTVLSLRSSWLLENSTLIYHPLKFTVLRDATKCHLLVQIFHGIYDGTSIERMLSLVSRYYTQPTSVSTELVPSFRQLLPLGPLQSSQHSLRFWQSHLASWKPFSFPVSDADLIQSGSPTQIRLTLDYNKLDLVRKELSVQWSAVALALWVHTASKYFASSFTTGVISSGRSLDIDGVELALGPLFNTIPFHVELSNDDTWENVIKRCQSFIAVLPRIEHTSLRDIQKWCSGGRPLFESLFSFRQVGDNDWSHLWELDRDEITVDYPIAFEVEFSHGKLEVHIVVKPELARAIDLEDMSTSLKHVVSNLSVGSSFCYTSPQTTPIFKIPTAEISPSIPAIPQLSITGHALRVELSKFCGISPDQIDGQSSISSLGLDSIDIVRFSAHLRSHTDIGITPLEIMKAYTIENIINIAEFKPNTGLGSVTNSTQSKYWLETLNALKTSVDLLDLGLDIEQVLPPTPLQETMMAKMIQSDFEWYFNHDLREVPAYVDLDKLEASFVELVRKSPILRSVFVPISNANVHSSFALVFVSSQFSVEKVVLEDIANISAIMHQATKVAQINSGTSGLFQVRFITAGAKVFVLISIAHALYDGWSLSLLHEDLQSAYNGNLQSRPSPHTFLAHSFGTTPDAATDYWASYLASAPATIVPPISGMATKPEILRQELVSSISPALLAEFAKGNSLSMQSIAVSAWSAVLASLVGSRDVTFGAILSGRDLPGASDIMFPTMNTVAVRSVIHGTGLDFMRYVQLNMANMHDYQSYPLRQAITYSNMTNHTLELFNTLFIVQKTSEVESSHNQALLLDINKSEAQVEYPLGVEIEVGINSVTWRTVMDSSVWRPDLLSGLDKVLQALLHRPDETILSKHGDQDSIYQILPFPTPNDVESQGPTDICDIPLLDLNSWSAEESCIREVLSELSGVPIPEVSKSSTLYRLGLDSITAIKVSASLRSRNINLSARQLITAVDIPTMAATAHMVDEAISKLEGGFSPEWDLDTTFMASCIGVPVSDIKAVIPCLPMQPYMLSAWHKSKGSIFCPTFCYQLSNVTFQDLSMVLCAWDQTVSALPILRTVFTSSGNDNSPWLQVILKPSSVALSVVRHVSQFVTPFDSKSPLVRVSVSESDQKDIVFKLSISHALYDAKSLPAIIHVFTSMITALKSGTEVGYHVSLAPWRKLIFESHGRMLERKVFWQAKLQGCNVQAHPRSIHPEIRTACYQKDLMINISQLRESCASKNISIQAFLFAAIAQCVAVHHKSSKVVLGVYMGNTTQDTSLHDTFPTLRLLPLIVNVSGCTIWESAQGIQLQLHDLTDMQTRHLSMWELYSWTGIMPSYFVNFLITEEQQDLKTTLVTANELPAQACTGWTRDLCEDFAEHTINWVQESIDFELAIQEGHLDFGIFGVKEVVNEADARIMVDDIVSRLI